MFEKQSMTVSGVIIVLLSLVINPDDANTVVNNLMQAADLILPVVGIIMTYVGRYRQGDINWFGGRV